MSACMTNERLKQDLAQAKDFLSSKQIPGWRISLRIPVSIWVGAHLHGSHVTPFCGSEACGGEFMWMAEEAVQNYPHGASYLFRFFLYSAENFKKHFFNILFGKSGKWALSLYLITTPSRNAELMCWCCKLFQSPWWAQMLSAAGGIFHEMKCHQRYSTYVGVLIKSVFSDCELLEHAYLKLACLIGCVCVFVCAFFVRGRASLEMCMSVSQSLYV